jgi:GntR family transcriptional repressor for pyruvate dehydrogenase complex
MNMVSAAMYESRRDTVERATDLKESVEFHRTIYRLIRAGKSDEARAAMSEHLELAQRAFASEEEPRSNKQDAGQPQNHRDKTLRRRSAH